MKHSVILTVLVLATVSLNGFVRGPFFDETNNLEKQKTPFQISDPDFIRTLFLNYDTFASDLLWVGSVVSYGEQLREKRSNPYLLENGLNLAKIDPRFRRIYDWYSAVPLNAYGPATAETLLRIDGLYEVGITQMPNDGNLSFSAGMMFMGNSQQRTTEERLREYELGARRFEQSLRSSSPPPFAYPMKRYMDRKVAELRGEEYDPLADIEMLSQLYARADTPEGKAVYAQEIASRGGQQSDVFRAAQNQEKQRKHLLETTYPFLDTGFLIAVNP